jgi:cytidylate kinase
MPVIALTQEMGSLAKDVAAQLAAELQIDTMRHEVAEHVAQKMHVPKSLINRLREGNAGPLERLRADRASLAVYTAEEVLETAARGNVVLRGWGATCLLHPVPHVVCVRVTRPLKERVAWLMTHLDTDDAGSAEDEIRRSDQAHAARMHEQFGVTWGDPLLYDLVLNTERLSVDSCVQQIRALVLRPEFAETPASVALLKDMALQAHVRSALRADESTRGVSITIDSQDGRVVLRGIVADAREKQASEAVAGTVANVKSVDNQLRTMAGSRLFASAKY